MEKAPRYGVLVAKVMEKPQKSRRAKKTKGVKMIKARNYIELAKKPIKLHLNKPSPELMDTVLKRSSSELCRAYLAYEELYDQTKGKATEDDPEA